MRALVTGCAGFIGSHLTESLLADGHEVVGVDALTDTYAVVDKLHNLAAAREWTTAFSVSRVDLADAELEPLVDGCDVVFHLAGEPGVRASFGPAFERYVRNNVLATQRLLDAVARCGRPRVVLASSSSVYGESLSRPTPETATPAPVSPYGVTKLTAEQLAGAYGRSHGLDVVRLRYFSVYGPRQRPDMACARFCAAALEGRAITVLGDGRQTRDFTYVSDVVAATRAAGVAARASGATLNVGGGSATSLRDVIDLLSDLAAQPVDVEHEEAVTGDVRHTAASNQCAAATLGWAPRVGLADGLRAQWEWASAAFAGRRSRVST
jgi:UDP-glucuronate 4-epimerase